MKKIFAVIILIATCVSGAIAQDYVVEKTEKNMVLPDGIISDVLFFKKWGDAGKYESSTRPKNMKTMVGVKAKNESELGYLRKTYKSDEDDAIAALCAIHKETGSKYSIAWKSYDNRITRYMFTYKSGNLIIDRMDFFDETNKTYLDYVAKENAKQEKMNKVVEDVTKTIMSPVADAAVAELEAEKNRSIQQSNNNSVASSNTTSTSSNTTSLVDHEKNRNHLAREFINISNEIMGEKATNSNKGTGSALAARTSPSNNKGAKPVTDAELQAYESYLQNGYSVRQAAERVFNEFRL